MGCGISIFDHSQRNAAEECYKQKVGNHHCGIIPRNTTTTTTSNSSPPPTTIITLSSPPRVFTLDFSTKSTSSLMHGCGNHQDLQPRPEPSYHPTDECVLPPPLQHSNNHEATDDHHALADGDGGINLLLLHRLGSVDDPDLKEIKSTNDVNHNDAAAHGHHHHHRNNNSGGDNQEEVGAKIPDYDGPLWIASPSFREYCIADSDSDDSSEAAAGNQSREMIENWMQRPRDNIIVTLSDEDSGGIIRQASGTRRVKKTRLTVGKVLTRHRPKAAVFKNLFSNSSACSSSNANGPAKLAPP